MSALEKCQLCLSTDTNLNTYMEGIQTVSCCWDDEACKDIIIKKQKEEIEKMKAKLSELEKENKKQKDEIDNWHFCDQCGMSDYNPNSYHHCECGSSEEED